MPVLPQSDCVERGFGSPIYRTALVDPCFSLVVMVNVVVVVVVVVRLLLFCIPLPEPRGNRL